MRNRFVFAYVIAVVSLLLSTTAFAQCRSVGGTIMTDFSVVDANTTLGSATGDLKGAVAATILGVSNGPNNTVLFSVQHHFVTDDGEIITVAQATATSVQVSPGLYAIISYPITITGGTGRFKNASGTINNIGEADLVSGHTIFRYSGKLCYGD